MRGQNVWSLKVFIALAVIVAPFAAATATNGSGVVEQECLSAKSPRRIDACTQLLADPTLDTRMRASAFAMRALALSLLGQYTEAISDYDNAIKLDPNFPIALNNRAWAYYRMGNLKAAWPDVQRSLALDPWSGHAYDTRAHLYHAEGNAAAAYQDYQSAMRFGGKRMIKLYQCGLQAHGHYPGPLDGILSEQLLAGLKVCTADKSCDPLPPDEECKIATS